MNSSTVHNDCCADADAGRGPQVNQPAGATGNHGNTPVSAHHGGYTKDVCVYIVHMLQPPKSTPAHGLITDTQQCMQLLCNLSCHLAVHVGEEGWSKRDEGGGEG